MKIGVAGGNENNTDYIPTPANHIKLIREKYFAIMTIKVLLNAICRSGNVPLMNIT